MTDPLPTLMQRYRSRGVLVDTNILLLYFVGKFKREQVPNFKADRSVHSGRFRPAAPPPLSFPAHRYDAEYPV